MTDYCLSRITRSKYLLYLPIVCCLLFKDKNNNEKSLIDWQNIYPGKINPKAKLTNAEPTVNPVERGVYDGSGVSLPEQDEGIHIYTWRYSCIDNDL